MTAPQPNPDGCDFQGYTAPALAGGSLYALAYGHVIKYSPHTGKVAWDIAPDPTFSFDLITLSVASGLALNTGTGKTMATLWPAGSLASGLAVGDGRIAVVSDGQILDLYGLPGY